MLRPVTPFVEYIINYDYISKVLCINKDEPQLSCKGKCHLMKKLEQQEQEDFNLLRINMEEYPIGFVNLFISPKEQPPKKTRSQKIFSYKQNYCFTFNPKIFHPPTV